MAETIPRSKMSENRAIKFSNTSLRFREKRLQSSGTVRPRGAEPRSAVFEVHFLENEALYGKSGFYSFDVFFYGVSYPAVVFRDLCTVCAG